MSYDCVCDYDSPEVYRSKTVKARKQYGCYECAGRIFPGDLYEYHFGVMYGDSYSGHTCIKCVEIREWVAGNIPCFCWAHGNIIEDARGAIDEACYRAPEETVGIRFGFARRLRQRDEYHRVRSPCGTHAGEQQMSDKLKLVPGMIVTLERGARERWEVLQVFGDEKLLLRREDLDRTERAPKPTPPTPGAS